jgi:hypothetical protein
MWGLDMINEMNAEAGAKARELNIQPLVLTTEEYAGLDTVVAKGGFPNLGDFADDVDGTFERLDTLFCDSSGFGSPSDPALNHEQLERTVGELLDIHEELLFGIVEVGQFQLHLGIWKSHSARPEGDEE